ncbi:uncharacterized protein CANTADRAFT_245141 [Suhomyces tanzawaensis NRRL Y-17324]|uniref:Uncharacterized protein n=1 Tax=Suhomyces tanzawaensis NRRL Y-17324 TaxID=984487 RepID=A0A1E4SHV1_9ASCO|nr:uncharacterized protein CANTADRAFT_245141 [Suhomyces tanzawaensis NRRL Y-17324]ODV79081.1 hypothetical protein CANTADRAFT_245141 [Suhomyces tanzawaensis NRRL Y-17324]
MLDVPLQGSSGCAMEWMPPNITGCVHGVVPSFWPQRPRSMTSGHHCQHASRYAVLVHTGGDTHASGPETALTQKRWRRTRCNWGNKEPIAALQRLSQWQVYEKESREAASAPGRVGAKSSSSSPGGVPGPWPRTLVMFLEQRLVAFKI